MIASSEKHYLVPHVQIQELALAPGLAGLEDPPDVLGLIQGHLQQVPLHHQLLQLFLGGQREL